MLKLVCLGDSITSKEKDPNGILKLTPRLKQALPDWTIINSGVSGDNTTRALNRLQTDVLNHFLDLWSELRSRSNYYKLLKAKDGVHFNQQGYEFLTQTLAKKIQLIMC